MKTEYKPIAMRCNQEQFESIKDRIELPINKDINMFPNAPFLTNAFNGEKEIGLIYSPNGFNRETIETFDAELFLDCCGREKEEVWCSSEMEFLNKDGKWGDFAYDFQIRFKPQPNYEKEIEALQQKAKENGQSVTILFEKL